MSQCYPVPPALSCLLSCGLSMRGATAQEVRTWTYTVNNPFWTDLLLFPQSPVWNIKRYFEIEGNPLLGKCKLLPCGKFLQDFLTLYKEKWENWRFQRSKPSSCNSPAKSSVLLTTLLKASWVIVIRIISKNSINC